MVSLRMIIVFYLVWNRVKISRAGGIDVIIEAMSSQINDAGVCYSGCGVLWNTSTGIKSIQEDAVLKGGLVLLLSVIEKYGDNMKIMEKCCAAMGTLLSSTNVWEKFCSDVVVDAVEKCHRRFNDSKIITQFYLGLKRTNDPYASSAISMGFCTKEKYEKCSAFCRCDDGVYCPNCYVQQKGYRCITCDKGEPKLYCKACWEKDHKGHKGEEFFCPMRCASQPVIVQVLNKAGGFFRKFFQ